MDKQKTMIAVSILGFAFVIKTFFFNAPSEQETANDLAQLERHAARVAKESQKPGETTAKSKKPVKKSVTKKAPAENKTVAKSKVKAALQTKTKQNMEVPNKVNVVPSDFQQEEMFASLRYVKQGAGAKWKHTWRFAAPKEFLEGNEVSIKAYLWHKGEVISQVSLLKQETIAQLDEKLFVIYFRMNDKLEEVNKSESKLYFRVSSNETEKSTKTTFIKLRNMNKKKFFVNRGRMLFSSNDDDLWVRKSIFQVKSPDRSSSKLVVKFEVTAKNNPSIAH